MYIIKGAILGGIVGILFCLVKNIESNNDPNEILYNKFILGSSVIIGSLFGLYYQKNFIN